MKRPCWFLVVSVVFVCVCAEVTPAAWSTPAPSVDEASNAAADASQDATITIPGPLRSFLRMAGISQKVSLDEVLPFLARIFGSRIQQPADGILATVASLHPASARTIILGGA